MQQEQTAQTLIAKILEGHSHTGRNWYDYVWLGYHEVNGRTVAHIGFPPLKCKHRPTFDNPEGLIRINGLGTPNDYHFSAAVAAGVLPTEHHPGITKNREIVIAEIGSFHGLTTTLLAWTLKHSPKRSGKVIAIDPWINDAVEWQTTATDPLEVFMQNWLNPELGIHNYIQPRRQLSLEAAKEFKPKSIDICFIDGLHDYDSCLADLEAYWPLMKDDGILYGHDYYMNLCTEVPPAVEEFCRRHRLAYKIEQPRKSLMFRILLRPELYPIYRENHIEKKKGYSHKEYMKNPETIRLFNKAADENLALIVEPGDTPETSWVYFVPVDPMLEALTTPTG